MRLGLLPSQRRELDKAFKKARAFDRFRQRTRRSFVALGALAFGGTVGGFWAGQSMPRETNVPASQTPDWLMELAVGPASALRAQAVHVVAALETADSDHPLWLAYHRLVEHLLLHPEDETLRRQLKRLAARDNAPGHARESAANVSPSRR